MQRHLAIIISSCRRGGNRTDFLFIALFYMNLNILPNIHCFADIMFNPGGYEPPRILYDNEMVYVPEGKNDITVGPVKYVVGANCGIVIPPGVVHFSENPYAEPAHRLCIHFDWYGAQPKPEKICARLKDGPPKAMQNDSAQPIVFTLSGICRRLLDRTFELLKSNPSDVIALKYSFGELLARISSEKSAGRDRWNEASWNRMNLMGTLKSYIESNYAKDIGYDDFCEATQRSAAYVCSNFKKMTGLNPTEYLIEVRIFHAERLLNSTLLPIDEICARVGIPDHNYFSRLFKRRNKLSPSEYRRAADGM